MSELNYIADTNTNGAGLEIYECNCGFYIGLDTTYLEQVGDLSFFCPCCKDHHHLDVEED